MTIGMVSAGAHEPAGRRTRGASQRAASQRRASQRVASQRDSTSQQARTLTPAAISVSAPEISFVMASADSIFQPRRERTRSPAPLQTTTPLPQYRV